MQADDLLVACEPLVEPLRILERLRRQQQVRLTLLRWHKGPAPPLKEAESFEVTIRRSGAERLGLRLGPGSDPTRTCISEAPSEGPSEGVGCR